MNDNIFCLSSDLFYKIPDKFFFPISSLSGFNKFEFSEEYLYKLIRTHGESYDLKKNLKFSEITPQAGIVNNLIKMLDDLSGKYNNDDDNNPIQSNILSFKINSNFFIYDNLKFEKNLKEVYSNILNFLYHLECPYLIINIEPLPSDINTFEFCLNEKFKDKYLDRLTNRIKLYSKYAKKENVKVLLSLNIEKLILQNELHSPFIDFNDFRNFYDTLIEDDENLGCFLDINSYFSFEIKRIINSFIRNENLRDYFESNIDFQSYLLKNIKYSSSCMNSLKNMEFIEIIGLNDNATLDIGKILRNLNIKDNIKEDLKLLNIENMLQRIKIRHSKNKCFLGSGSLPINYFLFNLRYLNSKNALPHKFIINNELKFDEFDISKIDWRYIDISKINIDTEDYYEIYNYIKNNSLNKIDYMDKINEIFSPIEIKRKIIKNMKFY